MTSEVRFFSGGYCRQLLASIDGRSLRVVRFHAVFLAVNHPRQGWILCDTGYGGRFHHASRRWPYRLYRYATPVTENLNAAQSLARAGISARDVRHIVLTHFHADHVGGLADFPQAKIHFHEDAWSSLAKLSPFRQTKSAFLPDLVPEDLATRSHLISRREFSYSANLPFPIYDLWGDESMLLVDLPGHAPGHLGLVIDRGNQRMLYSSDAYWLDEQISSGVNLPWPTLRLQWDRRAYVDTVAKLRTVRSSGEFTMLACHDVQTLREVGES